MQVVIEIPEEYRELFVKDKFEEKFNSLCTNEFGYVLRKAFENGIVLPKGHCKDCKHFEYDTVAKVDGMRLICAHEICKRWGDGCKTKEDGYCFLFEPQESED